MQGIQETMKGDCMNTVMINTTALTVKEYKGQRVVTLKEIDEVHQRPERHGGKKLACK